MASTTRRLGSSRRRRSSYDVVPHWVSRKRVIALLLAVSVGIVGVFGVRISLALAKAFHTNPVSAVISALGGGHGSAVDQSAQRLQRINIMLYGYGGGGHDGAFLTDSLMLISVLPEPNGPPQVAEISIPRDWYAPILLGNGRSTASRINSAYADGMLGEGPVPSSALNAGAAVANPTFNHLLGVHIDYWVGVDFSAFEAAVNAVGGVDVNVPNGFTDYQYPHGECAQGDCSYEVVSFRAGVQHMNGATALIFARSRHGNNGEGSDFARSRRQQLIIAALKAKVESIGGFGNLPDLLNALGDNVLTNLSIGDAESLYGLVKDVNIKNVEHVSIDNTNFLYDCGYPVHCGAYYLYAHDKSFGSLARFVQNIFPTSAALAEKAPVTFTDASGRGQDASGRWASLMSMIGLVSTDGGKAKTQTVTQVIDSSGGKDAQVAKWLANYFGVSVTVLPPPSPATSAPGGVTVVLGSAEESSFVGNPGIGT